MDPKGRSEVSKVLPSGWPLPEMPLRISRTFAAWVSAKSGSRGQGGEIWRGAVALAFTSVGIRGIPRRTIHSGAGNPLHPLFLLAAALLICLEGLVRFAVAGGKKCF